MKIHKHTNIEFMDNGCGSLTIQYDIYANQYYITLNNDNTPIKLTRDDLYLLLNQTDLWMKSHENI